MRHGLIGSPAVVNQEVNVVTLDVTRAYCFSHTSTEGKELFSDRHCQLVNVLAMRLGNHQNVAWPPWKDVHECHEVVIFVDDTRRFTACDDLTKSTQVQNAMEVVASTTALEQYKQVRCGGRPRPGGSLSCGALDRGIPVAWSPCV